MIRSHLLTALALLALSAGAETVIDYTYNADSGIDTPTEDLRIVDGASVTAPWLRLTGVGEGTTHFTMTGGSLVGTAANGKVDMPCDDVEYAICLGYGPGYVVANLGGGVIDCPNGLFCVSREAYTTCMVTGTVIRCRGFRLRAGEASGYATFILGEGGELDITGDWGLRSFHDTNVNKNYVVGDKDFRYYLEMRGGKIRFEEGWQGDLAHAPCLIMAPDMDSEFYVADGKIVSYAGQLQGEGTLHKTGGGRLMLSSAYIHNEGTIVIEEGSMEMYTERDLSRFYGNVIVRSGAALYLKGQNAKELPDEIEVCRNGTVTIEPGAEVWFYNKTTGTNTRLDMTTAVENGGYLETRSNYRIGVNMNLGTHELTAGTGDGVNNSVAVMEDEVDVGGYPEPGSTWGYTRSKGNGQNYTDVMKIYSRSDIRSYVRFAYFVKNCGTGPALPPYTNGNMRVTKRFFNDGLRNGQRDTSVFTAVNALYKEETVEMPAPPNARAWQMRLEEIPYAEFDIYLIYAADVQGEETTRYAPVNVRVTSADGRQTSGWRTYSYSTSEKKTIRTTGNWGGEPFCAGANMVEGVHYLRVHLSKSEAEAIGLEGMEDLVGCSVDIAPGEVSRDPSGHWQVRACVAGIQIVPTGEPMPELNINEYTAFDATKNIYNLNAGESFELNFTATNENSSIGFVHSLSNDIPVAPRILVNGREFPRIPGPESRYSFAGANSDKIILDVRYLPWRDNQTNDLTLAQFGWVTNRWGGDVASLTPSNLALNAASVIEGADRDGDELPFQLEYITDSDLTKNSNPMHLVIVGRAVSNDCLWLDVEYTRTENGIAATNVLGQVSPGWLGVTNGVDNPPYLRLGLKGGDRFSFDDDRLRPFGQGLNRGANAEFTTSITNTISLPMAELTNRFFRATMEAK